MDASVTGEMLALSGSEGREAARPRSRRSWTLDEKLAIVREVETSGDPVAVVARRHGMNANHLFIWRQKARDGTLGQDRRRRRSSDHPAEPMRFIELGVVGPGGASRPARIEIELPSGAVVRAPASATGEELRAALMAMKAAGL